jgi:hypothetical protein
MAQIAIVDEDGQPILYAYLYEGKLKFEFEYFGRTKDEGDYEVIYTVEPEDFGSISDYFNLQSNLNILEQVQSISNLGLGNELKIALTEKKIK